MNYVPTKSINDHEIEIIPPKREKEHPRNMMTCQCCKKKRSASKMDADGCGICEECLAS